MSQNRTTDGVRDFNDEIDPDMPDDFSWDQSEPQQPGHPSDGPSTAPPEIPLTAVQEAKPSDQSCVMLGPARSGKTTLLTAIKRACDLPAEDDLELEFIAGKETAEKIKSQIQKIVARQEGHGATESVGTYPFEVHVSAKPANFWSPPLEVDLYVEISDGAGGFLLPSKETLAADQSAVESRRKLIETALNATSMILCIDVTRPGSTLLEKELAISFAEMSTPAPFSSTVHWTAKLWAWLQRRPIPQGKTRWKRCLNVDRFLLLLTQVDKFCQQLPDSIDRTVRFAEMIDPVEQARQLLGVPVLKTIQNALKPGACLAVGVISAMGFHPVTGDPFADSDGTPLNLYSEPGEDILRRWTPFGIRDAIYFLATGECRGRVKRLRPNDLRAGAEPMDFSYSSKLTKRVEQ